MNVRVRLVRSASFKKIFHKKLRKIGIEGFEKPVRLIFVFYKRIALAICPQPYGRARHSHVVSGVSATARVLI